MPVKRMRWLDIWRGATLMAMIAYHILVDCVSFEYVPAGTLDIWWIYAAQKGIVSAFIFISGMSVTLSHAPARRGCVVLLGAAAVTAVSSIAGMPVLFGVLHFLGIAMLLYALLQRYLKKLPDWLLPIIGVVGFAVSLPLTDAVVEARYLWPLGLTYAGFSSADYVPIFPWIFLFLFGSWAVGRLPDSGLSGKLGRVTCCPLEWLGRHSLFIYLLHQPVLFGIFWLLEAL